MDITSMTEELRVFVFNPYNTFLNDLSVDCVIFGFNEGELKVLLLKWKVMEKWSLPGGFILSSESIEDAAIRVLAERTGLNDIYLRQFQTFGSMARSGPELKKELFKKVLGIDLPKDSWLLSRFVSIGYYALVDFKNVTPTLDAVSESAEWWNINEIPDDLILDHNLMINKALAALRLQISTEPIGLTLLPEKFTLPELQKLYEAILGKSIDRRNFRKKMLTSEILDKLDEVKTGGAHRAAHYYSFNKDRYNEMLEEGLKLGF